MIRSLTTAATGMIAQELRMNVTANNLANASTTGFKRARAEFEELMTEKLVSANAPPTGQQAAPSPLEVGLGVKVGATQRNFSRGDVLVTNNDMDIYIEGDGFLKVTRPNGTLAYTRAGNFRVDGQGRLVTQGGLPLDPPVQIPDDAKKSDDWPRRHRCSPDIRPRAPHRHRQNRIGDFHQSSRFGRGRAELADGDGRQRPPKLCDPR
jgi:flagellar basal-body rod protein FlgG